MWYITQSRSSILLGDRRTFVQILFLIAPSQCRVNLRKQLTLHNATGMWLRGGGRGFPPATKNVAAGYFHRKIGEKYNQKKFLAVWFPSYLLYLPSNLKPKWHPWLKTAPCGRFARGTLLLFLRFYLKLETLIIMGKFSCCVPGCTSNWRNSPNVKFHTLPTQPNVKETYVRLIRNPTLKKDVLTTRICGAHFPNGENIWAPDRNWAYDLAYTGQML